ncbi:MAG: glycosyltransferase [Ilumatobacter sp.]|nr:glycosyltransferase [Ilumatobacter sp.]
MRILIVAHGYPPREPGVWTRHLVHELRTRHSVWVYARTGDPGRAEREQWDEPDGTTGVRRVNVLDVDPLHRFADHRHPGIDALFAAYLDEVQPDVVHLEHTIGLSATMVHAARARGIPVVLSLYDYWLVCQRAFLLRHDGSTCAGPDRADDCVACVEGPATMPLAPRLLLHDARIAQMRGLLDAASIVTACSQSLQQSISRLLALPPGAVRHVELGVPPLAAPVVHRPSTRVRVAYLGVIAAHKGVHTLARAAALLGDLDVEVRLHGAPMADNVAEVRAVCDRIVVEPSYSRDELPAILARTDIVVLPSLAAETFSFAVREAARADVAVIASRVGALPEFIRDGETGLLVTPGDAAELAGAIRRLVTDPALRHRLATTHLPIRPVAEYAAEMEGLYAEAVGAQGAPA